MNPSLTRRSSGLLLHLTSLPGPWFLGDLGASARTFVDFLAASGQSWWQMLPVNPIGDGNSPYSTISSFAGETMLIDLADLVRLGWLKRADAGKPQGGAARSVNFDAARAYRGSRLRLAFQRAEPKLGRDAEFQEFCAKERAWLDDFTLFGALGQRFNTLDWSVWPEDLKRREGKTLLAAGEDLAEERRFLAFGQYLFNRQWTSLKKYAGARGIGLIGDLPIFVSHRSADCWAHRQYFQLNADMKPRVVAGCPPDAFNRDGQLWGNALYDWPALERDGFSWWLARLARLLSLFDSVRLDHFIGFHRYWEIDAKAKSAKEGKWMPAPGDAFFAAVRQRFVAPELIAEDLGAVIPAVRALRDKYGFPGMKVLQFAFDGSDEAEHHKPHHLPANAVAYTGTHDNNTTRGWYSDLARRARGRDKAAVKELKRAREYLATSERTVHWDLLRAAMFSQANVTIFPVQDLLGLGTVARMNVPGVAKGNWRYRLSPDTLGKSVAEQLKLTTEAFDRGQTASGSSSS